MLGNPLTANRRWCVCVFSINSSLEYNMGIHAFMNQDDRADSGVMTYLTNHPDCRIEFIEYEASLDPQQAYNDHQAYLANHVPSTDEYAF